MAYPDVAFSAQTLTGLSYDTTYLIYYDDEALDGRVPDTDPVEEIDFLTTTNAANAYTSEAYPFRHFVGFIRTPVSGAADTGGGGSGPPSKPDPDPNDPDAHLP